MKKETFSFIAMVILMAIGGLYQYSFLCGTGLIIYGLHGAVAKEYNNGSKKVEGMSAAILGLLFIMTGVIIIIHSYKYGVNYMWHRWS